MAKLFGLEYLLRLFGFTFFSCIDLLVKIPQLVKDTQSSVDHNILEDFKKYSDELLEVLETPGLFSSDSSLVPSEPCYVSKSRVS